MAADYYWVGVVLAICAGANNNVGTLLQKQVVNVVAQDQHFGRSLLKSPRWMVGFLMQVVLGTILMMTAQTFVGPGIVPGLMASGLIVLAIGSVKILKESLKPSEYAGVFLLIAAMVMLSQSHLSIDLTTANFLAPDFILRTVIFTVIIFGLFGFIYLLQRRMAPRRGVLLALCSGLTIATSNYWVALLIGVFAHVMGGTFRPGELIIFVTAAIILVGANLLGLVTIQKAFTSGQASNLIPVQYVPMQLSPIFVYFLVFFYTPPSLLAAILGVGGIFAVIISGFLLGRRQAQIDRIKVPTPEILPDQEVMDVK